LLIDPFITPNPKASAIDIDNIKADYILITHAHYDHVMDVELFAEKTRASLIANFEIVTYYAQKNLSGHALGFGGSWQFPFGRVKMVNAIHSSSFPDGANGGNPAGFVIESGEKTIYIAGDTALTMDMKLLPLFHSLDLAVLPVGGNFTMDIDEALIASDFIDCDRVLGVHYDTAEAITIDHTESKQRFEDKGKTLTLLPIGDSMTI
jgi:L-ascorbate metabolism protein UlaG (beta-lactamase superfamily)